MEDYSTSVRKYDQIIRSHDQDVLSGHCKIFIFIIHIIKIISIINYHHYYYNLLPSILLFDEQQCPMSFLPDAVFLQDKCFFCSTYVVIVAFALLYKLVRPSPRC